MNAGIQAGGRRAQARTIVACLQEAGHAAFWVGGCVRDSLLGREPEDYDVATSARPEQIEALFARTIPVGRQFGVLLVVVEGEQYQVSTFRAEGPYRDGRRPSEVRFTDAVEDARRRDLTVNGLFFDPVSEVLHDWVGGQEDLRARRIRTIGDPAERLAEDYLRLMRVVRFAAQLDFTIEPATLSAVEANAAQIHRVSAERIREELIKLFRPPHAARGLDLLRESGLLREVLPEVATFVDCVQSPDYHPEGSVYDHVRQMLALLPADSPTLLPWVALLHDVAKPVTASRDAETGTIHFYGHERVGADMTQELMSRLRFPRKEVETAVAVVRQHMQFKDVTRMRKATLRRLLMRETFPLELELHRLDCLGSHGRLDHHEFLLREAEALAQQPQIRPPLLRGDDLLALGMAPGRELGALLAEVREKQLSDELSSRDEALAWVKERIASGSAQ